MPTSFSALKVACFLLVSIAAVEKLSTWNITVSLTVLCSKVKCLFPVAFPFKKDFSVFGFLKFHKAVSSHGYFLFILLDLFGSLESALMGVSIP